MSNILIAQIGRGFYIDTQYMNGEHLKEETTADFTSDHSNISKTIHTTGYTFEAIIHEIGISMKKTIDHVILIGTETSYFGTLLHYYYEKSIGKAPDVTPEKYEHFRSLSELKPIYDDIILEKTNIAINNICKHVPLIETLLSQYISIASKSTDLKIHLVIIRPGTHSEELEENFNLLRSSVEHILDAENDTTAKKPYNIFFDISNGFRSLPMYIYTFINYLLRIRDEDFKLHMFYGMADGKKKDIAPIVNLENINGMMEWINAANEFHNYGSVRQLDRLLQENTELHTLFHQFDYASNANNLGVLKTTTENIIELENVEHFTNLPHYAKSLLNKIGEEFHQEFGQEHCNPSLKQKPYSYAYLTIHLAHWYIEQGRTGNAAIALQEGITTFLMERWTDETDRLIAASQSKSHGNYFDSDDNTKWLFDYKNRSVIGELFKQKTLDLAEKIESETEMDIIEKMAAIRKYIRNPEAHILINQVSEQIIEKSQLILRNMIDWMLHMTSDKANETDEQLLYCYLPVVQITDPLPFDIKNLIISYFKEIVDLSKTSQIIYSNNPEVWNVINTLENDLIYLNSCQFTTNSIPNSEKDEIALGFQNELSSRQLLCKVLEKWQNYDTLDTAKNPKTSIAACRKILKIQKEKTTIQRLMGWIGTNCNVMADIILSEISYS